MPRIGLWTKLGNDEWKYGHMNIVARIRGEMGTWRATIEDSQFNGRFDYESQTRRYTTARDNLWDQMRVVNRAIRGR